MQLNQDLHEKLEDLEKKARRKGTISLPMTKLLSGALKNELEAADIAALWMPGTSDLDLKMAFARQVGDETKHFRLIQKRMMDLGLDSPGKDLASSEPSPLFLWLKTLEDPLEQVAAAPFAREAVAVVRNRVFIHYCRENKDFQTASLYEDIIQRDEESHHNMGRELLDRMATTSAEQKRARAAALRTVELVEEIQEIAFLKKGISQAPGC